MVKTDKGMRPKKRNALKYGMIGLISIFLLYHSFYTVSLDSLARDSSDEEVAQLAEEYFSQTLPEVMEGAPAPCALLHALSKQEDNDWRAYGKQTNIGSRYYFLVRGEGTVQDIEDNVVHVAFSDGVQTCSLRVATVYIFGNEIRDASGELLLQDIGELTKFNALSGLINKKVRDEIVPGFLEKVEVGQKIRLDGAFALNRRIGITDDFEVMPIQVQIID